MFSNLAWSRVLTTVFFFSNFISLCYATHQESLFTSSVTYCNPPETLLIQRFEVAYFPANTSVSFNVSAASVQANVNVTANLFLNIYGMNPVNVTLDLCNILNGALCPLPMYNFTGADSITLPKSLSVAEKIPGIAFKIPDLEGFAQLSLTEISTGHVKACVQATLSNGWSAHQEAVEWSTGGVALATLAAAAVQSLYSPHAVLPFRLLELMYLFQSIATSSFLNLNYPSVYRAFALNFAWAVGLISSPESKIQQSINRMRHLTGGHLPDAMGGSPVGLVNRKLSPYNSSPNSLEGAIPMFLTTMTPSFPLLAKRVTSSLAIQRETIKGEVQTVTPGSSNVLQAGIPIFVNSVFVPTANVFTTVFLISLCLIAIVAALLFLGFLAFHLTSRKRKVPSSVDYLAFAKGWLLRLALLVFFPLLVFIFYQWTLKDSWLPIFLSVLSLIALAGSIGYQSYRVVFRARSQDKTMLYAPDQPLLQSCGPLYAQYRPERYYYFIPLLVAFVLKSLFISFATGSAEAQLSLIIIVEFALLFTSVLLKPANKRRGDVFWTYLAITRVVCTALMIAFLQRVKVKAIPRVVIGIVIAIVWSVSVIVLVFNIIWNGIYVPLRTWRRGPREANHNCNSPVDSQGSMLEKGVRNSSARSELSEKNSSPASASANRLPYGNNSNGFSDSIDEVARSRPVNPTPEHSIPMDPSILVPYPISPTATISTQMEPPSVYSRDSGTITVGSLLPRRWSFSLSQPGSPISSSLGHGQQRSSLTPSPMPPSPSDGGPVLSRNTSTSARVHLPTHEDIMEEEVASSKSIRRLESPSPELAHSLPATLPLVSHSKS